jgi:hypothetical protein
VLYICFRINFIHQPQGNLLLQLVALVKALEKAAATVKAAAIALVLAMALVVSTAVAVAFLLAPRGEPVARRQQPA